MDTNDARRSSSVQQNSDDVRDLDTVQLIILPPDKALPNRSRENDEAAAAAQDILLNRGERAPYP